MGKSGYIWCFCNKRIAFFHPDHSRGAAVIEEILGKDFKGIVVCDFYAAYNCLEKTQRCLVHLLRDIKKERDVRSPGYPTSDEIVIVMNVARDA